MPESKGHLNPGSDGVVFDRFELGPGLGDLVRHVWVVRWDIPVGEVRPQRVLTYPAFNAVFTPGEATLFGPDSRLFVRELSGSSWAVGILFRPATAPLLTRTEPTALVGGGEALPHAPVADVDLAMSEHGPGRGALARILRTWLLPLAGRVDARGRLVNDACRIAEDDPSVLRAAELAARVGLSPRTLERAVRAHVGMTPKWLIECRRLQHAATTLFSVPETDLTALALELGYADYAHFSRQYKRVLGESPEQTRRAAEGA